MRIDHHAYQRATKVAGMGLLLQFVIGIVLLVFGLALHDTAFQFASQYVLAGIFVWLGLIIIFHQHKLERLEALEEDELASTRGGGESVFDRAADESRVAARRLAMMHKWLMPAFSILLALILVGVSYLMLRYMGLWGNAREFYTTDDRGWAVAICLAAAAFSFIFSRFVAGMAKQQAWQNLRGGAAYMVGNSLILVAVAVGIIFRFFENEAVIKAIAWAMPFFILFLVAEILLNFILNLYRPRIPGDVPRPAFDSKILSLLATPDSIVRSLNEAVNYQFGFDVTSSWGYQLLLRSFVWLLVLGVAALVLLSTMVIVEPHQLAIRLRGGRIIDDKIHQSGVMWKLPWPLETANVYDVTRVRNLHLTARVLQDADVYLWSDEKPRTDTETEPFIVGSQPLPPDRPSAFVLPSILDRPTGIAADDPLSTDAAHPSEEDQAAEFVSNFYSLVDAEIVVQYRIKNDDQGLLDYLHFAPQTIARRQTLTERERALKVIAVGEVSEHLSKLSLDAVLSPGQSNLSGDLRQKIQAAFNDRKTGVEVVAVDLPMLRPSGKAAASFEELGIAKQNRGQLLAKSERKVFATYTDVIGDAGMADQVLAAIDEYYRLENEHGRAAQDTIAQRQVVEDMLARGGGKAAQRIANAEAGRWKNLMAKRKQFSRWQNQLASYRAGPELYRQLEIMKLYEQFLPLPHKYIIAIDPSRIDIDIDLKDINPIQHFSGASESEMEKK